MVEPVSFRCRKACLTPADLKVFAALLVENFPTARYFVPPHFTKCDGPEPSEVPIAFSLADLPDYEVYMTFDEDWLPQWGRSPEDGSWRLGYPKLPDVRFLIGRMRSADQRYPEHIDSLEIQCSCRPHRKEDFTMARRLFHLLGKVATNRNQVYVSYPGYEVVTVFEKGGQGSVWLGHDAIRWAREDPRRLLTMHASGRGGIRPMDDGGKVPDVVECAPPAGQSQRTIGPVDPDEDFQTFGRTVWPEPKKAREQAGVPVSFRARDACLSPADEQAFASALVEAFPTARYFSPLPLDARDGPKPPVLPNALSLGELPGRHFVMHFDEIWLPQWGRDLDRRGWELKFPCLPYVHFYLGSGIRPAGKRSPQHITESLIRVYCRPDNKDDAALARRLFSILAKVATNCRQVALTYPGYVTYHTSGAKGRVWLGFDAMRWAREDPSRLLSWMGWSASTGIRPAEE